MKDIRNYNLLQHNTFGIDARCSRYIEYDSVEDAQRAVGMLTQADEPLLLLGGGSNLLLTGDYPGTVLHSAIKGIEAHPVEDGMQVRCGSGEIWDDVVALSVDKGWYGAENLSLIPGEVGATAVQNIGAYGAEVENLIVTVEVVEIATGKLLVFTRNDCQYAYRQSRFKKEWRDKYLVTHVTYCFSNTFKPHLDYGNIRTELEREGIEHPTARQLRDAVIKIRRAKLPDPAIEGNAGSFFMNPIVSQEKFNALVKQYPELPHYVIDEEHIKIPAGWMIEQCGWKGRSVGHVGVHAKQALVLVNKGGATGEEVLNLCNVIRRDVKQKFDIDIHPEVNIK